MYYYYLLYMLYFSTFMVNKVYHHSCQSDMARTDTHGHKLTRATHATDISFRISCHQRASALTALFDETGVLTIKYSGNDAGPSDVPASLPLISTPTVKGLEGGAKNGASLSISLQIF